MTRLELYNAVIRIFKRTDKSTEIYEAYNETIKEIAARHPLEGLKFQSYVPTVEGQEDYPLPDTLCHIIHPIRLLEGSATSDTGWPLDHISKEKYDSIEPNPNRTSPDTGRPTAYCVYSNSILLTDIPDDNGGSNYLLEINWTKNPTTQSGDSDTHPLGSNWDEVLKWGTLWRLYLGLGLTEEAQNWLALYEDEKKGVPAKIALDMAKADTLRQVANNNL